MHIQTDLILKNSLSALTEIQVRSKRQELSEMIALSQQYEAIAVEHNCEDYAGLHGAITEVMKSLHELSAQELIHFSWRYEPINPHKVGDLEVRFTIYHNHSSMEPNEAQLMTVWVKNACTENEDELENHEVDMEDFIVNANSGADSPTMYAESVVWSLAGHLEGLRVSDAVTYNHVIVNHDGKILMNFGLGPVVMIINIDFEVLDRYEEYCTFLGREE